MQTGLEKNLLGNNLVTLPVVESRVPPAFASDPLKHLGSNEVRETSGVHSFEPIQEPSMPSSVAKEENYSNLKISSPDIVEIDTPTSLGNQFTSDREPSFMKNMNPLTPGATTRKGANHIDRQNSEISYYADDEDCNQKKYTRRGPLHHKFLRFLLPFWSSALPILPVTAPLRKDGVTTDDVPEGRSRHQRSSRMDPRKILLVIAIMACMATMGILYYRLAQRSLGEDQPEDGQQ